MEGVVYYPYIEVPTGPWLIRTLLYWNHAATIVPDDWNHYAESSIASLTRELARRELLHLTAASDAHHFDWHQHISSLPEDVLNARRASLSLGSVTRIHRDKLLADVDLVRLGLARPSKGRHYGLPGWIDVEFMTAAEYMAALAVGVSHPDSYLSHTTGARWVPITNEPVKFSGILRVSREILHTQTARHEARVRKSRALQPFRALLLERLFPVPDDVSCYDLDLDAIAAFKDRYGDQLPQFRRLVERRVNELGKIPDPDEQVWELDNLGDELDDAIADAEATLRRLKIKRITRSSLAKVLRLGDPTGVSAKVATVAEDVIAPGSDELHPLAYAAFAREGLMESNDGKIRSVPILASPDNALVDLFGHNAPVPPKRPRFKGFWHSRR